MLKSEKARSVWEVTGPSRSSVYLITQEKEEASLWGISTQTLVMEDETEKKKT